MTTAHPLDRPIWNALGTGWAHLARQEPCALRLEPDYGPFLAGKTTNGLTRLPSDDTECWVVETAEIAAPPGTRVSRTAILDQMVAEAITPGPPPPAFIELGEANAQEMQALAALTRPGPFHALTHRFGGFIGVREEGRLIAMAGERMRIPPFAEVSGVCTHPDHRGRGFAGALMRVVANRMLARGETPFLHAYAANRGAIALYETLGFRFRRAMTLTVLVRA